MRKTGKRRTAARRAPPNATPASARKILDVLERTHPEAECALLYRNPYELLMATILSAQCTDKRVNEVTPVLFARYPTPAALADAAPAELESIIRSTGFFRAKAKSLLGCSRALAEEHRGEVPRSLDTLVKLPGIGRKTANVVLGHAFGINEGIAVDTHVQRVANRLGLVVGDDPVKLEAALVEIIPRERWTRTTDLLIFHGRKICDARRPACGRCPLFKICAWPEKQAHALLDKPKPGPGAGRPRARGAA
jgi:endonuclease-3